MMKHLAFFAVLLASICLSLGQASASTATPSFSTGSGTYYASVILTMGGATPGSLLYYTTDGSTPTISSARYSAPVTISSTATVQAIAVANNISSGIKSATFTISPAWTPTPNTGTGTYYAPVTLSLNEASTCALVYYTTDGSTPTVAATIYSGPFTLTNTATLKAFAQCPGGQPSAVSSESYTITAPYAPGISAATGTYYSPVSVSVSEATKCAAVYYTTDGSVPTLASPLFLAPITISATTTFQAIAVCPGGSTSSVVSRTFTIATPWVPTPNTGTGTYYAPVSLSFSEATKCAVIYYTTDGSTPTVASAVYSGPFTLTSTATLKAFAQCPGGQPSAVSSESYTIAAPYAPGISAATGTYYSPVSVSVSEATKCAAVYYTTDGSVPTLASPLFLAPITISATTTFQAIAVCPGGSTSSVVSRTFTIATPWVPTPNTGTGTYYAPVSLSFSEATKCAVIYYTTDGSTPTVASAVYSGPLIVASTSTVQAFAQCPGGQPSTVSSATYTVSPAWPPSPNTGTGTYYAPVSLSFSEATKCAVVYYTTDGSAPTAASAVYSGPLTVASTSTLKAFAQCPGGQPSTVSSNTYTVSSPLPPSPSTGTGTYHAPVTVSLNEASTCAALYYTIDGSTPTTSSKIYAQAMTFSTTSNLQVFAQCPGGSPSTLSSYTFTITPAAQPIITLASGTYERSVSVSLADATSGAVIYYTTNGAAPTTSSAVYTRPVTFSNISTFGKIFNLQAIAAYPNGPASAQVSASYTILGTSVPIAAANSQGSFFGMNVSAILNGTPWPLVPVGTLRILSSPTAWSSLNPSSGTYNWSSLDKEIRIAQSNGAATLYTFQSTPTWAIANNLAITNIARSGGVVSVNTASPHNLYFNPTYTPTEQSSVVIAGTSDPSFNGTFVLTGTPTANSLTFVQTGADSTSSGGTLSAVCGGGSVPASCAEGPANLEDWDNFVTELVAHVGPGVIKYWELWNEANLDETWRGSPALLASMAADARKIIKTADPQALLLSPSTTINVEIPTQCVTFDPRCGSNWLINWLAAGGATTIDAIAFHGYPAASGAPETIQGAISLLQQSVNAAGIGPLPFVDTESSWALNSALPSMSDQVNFIGRHLLLEHSMGIEMSFWYAYDNTNWGTLWNSVTGLNDAGQAYEQVTRWLTNATLQQPCAPTTTDPTTFSCVYTRPDGYTATAVWNTVGTATFAVPAGTQQYRDLYGNLISVPQTTVQISPAPILLENASAF